MKISFFEVAFVKHINWYWKSIYLLSELAYVIEYFFEKPKMKAETTVLVKIKKLTILISKQYHGLCCSKKTD